MVFGIRWAMEPARCAISMVPTTADVEENLCLVIVKPFWRDHVTSGRWVPPL